MDSSAQDENWLRLHSRWYSTCTSQCCLPTDSSTAAQSTNFTYTAAQSTNFTDTATVTSMSISTNTQLLPAVTDDCQKCSLFSRNVTQTTTSITIVPSATQCIRSGCSNVASHCNVEVTWHQSQSSIHLIHTPVPTSPYTTLVPTSLMTTVPTLFSQVSETDSTGCRMLTSRRVLSCEAQSAHRYSGGGRSLHSDATVGSMHIYVSSHATTTNSVILYKYYTSCLYIVYVICVQVKKTQLISIIRERPAKWSFFIMFHYSRHIIHRVQIKKAITFTNVYRSSRFLVGNFASEC